MDKKTFIIFMLCLIIAAFVFTGALPEFESFQDEAIYKIDLLLVAAKKAKKERAEILARVNLNSSWIMLIMVDRGMIDMPHAVFGVAIRLAVAEAALMGAK